MIRPVAVLLCCLALSACQEDGDAPVDFTRFGQAQAECERSGGIWRARGETGVMTCIHYTRDSGKSCSASSDCEGLCLARSRSCSPVRPLFGCNEVLGANGVQSTICVD